ncbi:hypothetical protein [Sphingomonas gilva]|uniref:hypothetical protein n=1 Tax=Sphingomonas gilva TaxID=2305907 RepID=UPI0015FBDEDF|nr:hypothetical protein [Sphingomonas gilva]
MTNPNRDYHLKRAAVEESMAVHADDPATSRAHRDLAALHRTRAHDPVIEPPLPAA